MFNDQFISKCARALLRRKETIAVAESVTAGLLQAALASAEEAMLFFQGGITAYNINQKYTHLHIDLTQAVKCNCVSEQTALEMAVAVARSFSTRWGIAVTGYSSTFPGMEKLFACYAICFDGTTILTKTIEAIKGTPLEVQLYYVNDIFISLSAALEQKNNSG
jgi:nicotinamide-nucleotide amidase